MATDGALFLRGPARMLHNITDEQELEPHTHAPSSSSSRTNEDSFLMFASVIVGIVALAYFFCMYHIFRTWFLRFCCGRETSTINDQVILVHEGRIFDLNSRQRRAVLEAIFSETSKAVTEKDMMKPKRKRKNSKSVGGDSSFGYSSEDDEQVPYDVEIPTISTTGSEGVQDSSYSMEVQAEENHTSEGPNSNSKTDVSSTCQPMVRALSWDPTDTRMSPTRAVSPGPIASTLTRSSSWVGDNTPSEKIKATTPPSPKSSSPLTTLTPQQDAAVQIFHTPAASRDDSSDGGAAVSPSSSKEGGNCNSETGVQSVSSSMEETYGEPPPLYAASLIGATRGNDMANRRSLALPSSMNLKPRITKVAVLAESGESAAANAEESKQEEETVSSSTRSETPALSAPFTLLRVDSHSHYSVASNSEYTYDDETEGNVCAICLGGYKEGDVLIASKYCTHIFHKDCILEWLDKHDECPVCRVDMVTEGEINKAATSLVGKTRMCRAVASLNSAPLLRTSPPRRTPPTSPGPHGPHTPTNTVRRMGNSQR